MPNISISSKIAIAFVRPYRSYLEGKKFLNKDKRQIEETMRAKLDQIIEQAVSLNPSVDMEELIQSREALVAANMQLFESHDPTFDKIFPAILEDLIVCLEKELKEKFTEKELAEIYECIENPSMKKMLSNTTLFGFLKSHEIELEYKLKIAIVEQALNQDALNTIRDIKKKQMDERDEENEEEF